MTTHTPAWTTPEPGALEFVDLSSDVMAPEVVGFTLEEAMAFLANNTTAYTSQALTAAAEVHSGAMIAFIPTTDDLIELVLEDGEPLEQLHCTAYYLGDAGDIPDEIQQEIHNRIRDLAIVQPTIVGNVFGFSVWNPGGDSECAVADVGGADLEDAHDSVTALLDEMDFPYPDQHDPYRPHITLKYQPHAVDVLTDDVLSKVGPIAFDRIRVAFGGIVTDYPLGGAIVASDVFHLAGKHDQSTHGRGGLVAHTSSAEGGMAERLNGGGDLDPTDPEQAKMIETIEEWTHGTRMGLYGEINDSMEHPDADTRGASFTRMVASGEPHPSELYRGYRTSDPSTIPDIGHEYSTGPTSFSRSVHIASGNYAVPFNGREKVMGVITLRPGARSVRIDQHQGRDSWVKENVTLGTFRVVGRSERTHKMVNPKTNKLTEYTMVDLEIEQIG